MKLAEKPTEKQLKSLGYIELEKNQFVKIDTESPFFLGEGYPRWHIVIFGGGKSGGKYRGTQIHYDKYLEHSAKDGVLDADPVVDEERKRIGRFIINEDIKKIQNRLKNWKIL